MTSRSAFLAQPVQRASSFLTCALVLGVATTLVLSGCSSTSGDSSGAPAEAPTNLSAAQIDRAAVDSATDQIDGFVDDMMSRTGAPGIAVAVVYKDEVVYAKGFGVRKVGEPEPVDTSTMFQLASVSKPLASSVIATLVGDGKISWNEPVKRYEPGFVVADPYVTENATFTDLLSHRSGLPDHGGDLLEDLGYGYEEIVSRLGQLPLDRFRDNYAYSNYGFSVAGVAAAKSENTTWAELSEQTIYEPLGMSNTTSSTDEWLNAPNHAYNHVLTDPATNTWEATYVSNPEAQSPAGGASSSVDDMAAWIRMELADGMFDGRQIVDPEALQYTHQAHAFSRPATEPGARESFYGTGFSINTDDRGRVQVAHAGAFALGASTDVELLPSEDLGIVVLANTAPIGVSETISAQFMDYAKNGKLTVDWVPYVSGQFKQLVEHGRSETDYASPPAGAAPAQAISAYTGRFVSPFYGAAHVVVEGADLVLKLGRDQQLTYPLTHYDGDTYWFETSGENAVGPTGVRFTTANGTATSFTVEYLDAHDLGTFTKVPA
ncbi:serine hydrolase [Williamsia muralis]|uniref:serine hydrolase n=1 Tax=Williamsia marianensis TaxID=85044 RepID=UPI003F159B77